MEQNVLLRYVMSYTRVMKMYLYILCGVVNSNLILFICIHFVNIPTLVFLLNVRSF